MPRQTHGRTDTKTHGHTGTHIHTYTRTHTHTYTQSKHTNKQTNKHTNTHTLAQIIMKPCKALRMDATGNLHLSSDLIKNEPTSPMLSLALGLSYFASSEPGRLSHLGMNLKCFSCSSKTAKDQVIF